MLEKKHTNERRISWAYVYFPYFPCFFVQIYLTYFISVRCGQACTEFEFAEAGKKSVIPANSVLKYKLSCRNKKKLIRKQ